MVSLPRSNIKEIPRVLGGIVCDHVVVDKRTCGENYSTKAVWRFTRYLKLSFYKVKVNNAFNLTYATNLMGV
jgi:hypothetical protein